MPPVTQRQSRGSAASAPRRSDSSSSSPSDGNRSDATNYLGGVVDVLEDKRRRGELEHLGGLGDTPMRATAPVVPPLRGNPLRITGASVVCASPRRGPRRGS